MSRGGTDGGTERRGRTEIHSEGWVGGKEREREREREREEEREREREKESE